MHNTISYSLMYPESNQTIKQPPFPKKRKEKKQQKTSNEI